MATKTKPIKRSRKVVAVKSAPSVKPTRKKAATRPAPVKPVRKVATRTPFPGPAAPRPRFSGGGSVSSEGVIRKDPRLLRRVTTPYIIGPVIQAQAQDDTSERKFAVEYYDQATGTSKRIPCSAVLYDELKRSKTYRAKFAAFDLLVTPGRDRELMDVELVPDGRYNGGTMPDYLRGVKDLVVEITLPSGHLEVKQCPARLTSRSLYGILTAIDAVEEIRVGTALGSGKVERVINGNAIVINVPLENKEGGKKLQPTRRFA